MTLGRNSKQLNHTLRNLVSSLIIHEHITTTPAKAKLTANYIENLITKSKKHALNNTTKEWKHLLHGKLYNQKDTIPKMDLFVERYSNRNHGFTRMLKLDPRVGDNAPQVALELVDNENKELFFWYIAKVVARLELQGLPLDDLTAKNVSKVTKYKVNGEEKFAELVKLCKKEFFTNGEGLEDSNEIEIDIENDKLDIIPTPLENKPRMKSNTNGFNKQTKNFVVVPRS
ncbi:mitochondrial 54S ribosomal protein YmL8 [Pichia kluyveri]|uniref:Mitochondrial 54S ribosomal protein YmL8 n=1 Tax=Pichia kluyveri TaxID=36015 RepID=A0AAV5R393_PICKL|nr:mitochondrial 54S ribosomal protein YmL8 [Pichia kluyveri]